MYVSAFWAGVVCCILAELAFTIGLALFMYFKDKKPVKKEDADELHQGK